MNVSSEWIGIGIVLVLLCSLIGMLHFLAERYQIRTETSRKTVHVTMGMVSMTFPWIFESAWPVLTICVSAFVVLAALRWIPALAKTAGSVLRGVGRNSMGELCFPAAVAVLFLLSNGNPIYYCIPLIYLTIGDAAAAVVGTRYGSVCYKAPGGMKSLQGSCALFIVGLAGTYFPVVYFLALSHLEAIVIAVTLAIFVTLLEAIAWRGLDNLLIPLGGFFLLNTLLEVIST